jgi:hypothetical protein
MAIQFEALQMRGLYFIVEDPVGMKEEILSVCFFLI